MLCLIDRLFTLYNSNQFSFRISIERDEDMGSLTGKVALVTGAGTGLGRAIAILLAENGATVALNGRREEKLREVKNVIGERAIVLAGDASDEHTVNQLLISLKKQTAGKLDILVNNAGGMAVTKRIEDLSVADWQKMIDINGTTQFVMAKACLPLLRESESGKIISVTSGIVHFFMEGLGAYSAGKAAAEVLMKTLAVEEKENGVQVNLFDPINVATEGNPQGQHDPMEIAKAVLGLIESEHMTKHGEIVTPEV